MSSVNKGIATVVLGLGIAALLVSSAVSQDGREGQPVERKPDELWRLYPLDPESDREDQVSTAQTPRVPAPANGEESEPPGEVAPGAEAGSGPLPVLVAIVFAGGAALLIARRVRRSSQPDVVIGGTQTAAAPRPASEPQAPAREPGDDSPETEPEPGLVRVRLRDGRTMEGAVKYAPTQDSPVLLLEVVDVSDPEGHKHNPEPLDAFVPLAEIEHVESIGKIYAGEADDE